MGRKDVKIKVKLPFQFPSKNSNSNVSKNSNKMDASRSMIDAKILPRVNVSLTRLIPTKMPDTAKEQYFNLIKSSDILTVIPNDKTTWDTLSPESTPEKEIERTSRNSNLLSQSISTELQLSPVDLDTSCGDLSNEPWSEDNSEPYPSPKSSNVQENADFQSLSESSNASKSWSFREQEINEWFCRYPIVACDNEVESIMALQNGKVSNDAPTISLQKPHPKKDVHVLQTMAIPLQPVGEVPPFLVCRDELPVFERNGIWTTPVSKMAEKEKSLEKEGTKKKRGRPRKDKRSGSSEVPPQNKTIAVNSDVSSRLRSSTPLCIHDAEKEKTQKGEKENSLDATEQGNLESIESQEGDRNSLGEHTPRSPRMLNEQTPLVINIESSSSEGSLDLSCEVITDQVVRAVEKETKRKRGRPRKVRQLCSSDVPSQNKIVSSDSDVSSRVRSSTPLCHYDAEKEKTQKGEKENSLDATEQGNLESIESQEGDRNSLGEHIPRSPRMLNEQTPLVFNIESSSEDSLDSSCEVIADQMVRNGEKVKRKRGRPRKRRRLDSSEVPSQNKRVAVNSDVSSSVRSSTPLCTHDIDEKNVKVGGKEHSSNVAEQENLALKDKAENEEGGPYSRGKHTSQAPRMLNEETPLVINIESSSSEGSLDLSCEAITDQVVRDVEKEAQRKRGRPRKDKRSGSSEVLPCEVITDQVVRNVEKKAQRKRGRPRKVKELCSSDVSSQNKIVSIDSDVSSRVRNATPLYLHDAEKEKVEKGEKECSSNVAEKESLEGKTEWEEGGSNSRVEHTPQAPRMLNEETQLVINVESSSKDSLGSSCEVITEEVGEAVEDKQKTDTLVKKPDEAKKWLSAVQIEVSPLIKSPEMEDTKQGGKSPPRTTIFFQDHEVKCVFSKSNKSSNSQRSLDESVQQGRTKSTRQELFPSKCENRKPSKDAAENESLASRLVESSLSTTSTQDISSDSRHEKDEESVKSLEIFGKKSSPLRSLAVLCERLPVNKTNNHSCSDSLARNTSILNENQNTRDDTAVLAQQEVSKRSSMAEPDCKAVKSSPLLRNRESSALCLSKKDGILAEQENQSYELLKGNVHIVPCSPIQSSKPTIFRDKGPTISPKISATSLLDGTVRLTPCPLQISRTPVEWKQRERNDRRSSVAGTASSVPSPNRGNEMVAAANSFNSPVPLKNLVIKCDRLDANNYKILKSPDNIQVIPGKRKRKTTKKNLENESNRKGEKQGGKGEKRKRTAKSNKNAKPPKKRNLGIPEHYKNLKPSQLSSISHTRMRYRVAFTFWPKKYSGALDRINQRLINQNAFWNSLN